MCVCICWLIVVLFVLLGDGVGAVVPERVHVDLSCCYY